MSDKTGSSAPLSESLTRIAGSLLSEDTLNAALESIVELVERTVDGVSCAGIRIAPDGKPPTFIGNGLAAAIDGDGAKCGEGPQHDAMSDGKPVQVIDLSADGRWPVFRDLALARGVHSMLAIPLQAESCLGVLTLCLPPDGSLRDGDEEVAMLFAKQASIWVANSIAFARAEQLTEQLREALESREIIGQAKGIIMEREGCTGDEAFDVLRRMSQRANTKLRDVARKIVDSVKITPGNC